MTVTAILPTPTERVAALLADAGLTVHTDQADTVHADTGEPLSADAAFHWLFAVGGHGITRDGDTMTGRTRRGVTVTIPVCDETDAQ